MRFVTKPNCLYLNLYPTQCLLAKDEVNEMYDDPDFLYSEYLFFLRGE